MCDAGTIKFYQYTQIINADTFAKPQRYSINTALEHPWYIF